MHVTGGGQENKPSESPFFKKITIVKDTWKVSATQNVTAFS